MRRKTLAHDHPELLHAVSQTILRHDPFRANYHGYNFDEYDGEAAEVIRLIAQGHADVGLIAKVTSMLTDKVNDLVTLDLDFAQLCEEVSAAYAAYKQRIRTESDRWTLDSIPTLAHLPQKWRELIGTTVDYQRIFANLQAQLSATQAADPIFVPQPNEVFRAFRFFDPEDTKVIIAGHDPYPDPEYANGLAFGTKKSRPLPASLTRILRQTHRDVVSEECRGYLNSHCGIDDPSLVSWARQGVLLLNTALTIPAGATTGPRHRRIGWQTLTRAVATALLQRNPKIVVMLWGSAANRLVPHDGNGLVLRSAHPTASGGSLPLFGSTNHFYASERFMQEEFKKRALAYHGIQW